MATDMTLLESPDPGYVEHQRRTECDAAGRFSFEGLPTGLLRRDRSALVGAGNLPQGGPVVAPVAVDGNSSVDLIVPP